MKTCIPHRKIILLRVHSIMMEYKFFSKVLITINPLLGILKTCEFGIRIVEK